MKPETTMDREQGIWTREPRSMNGALVDTGSHQ
jgi:hypothetical protein